MNKIRHAGFWLRLAASLIDSLLIGIIILPILLYIYGPKYLVASQLIKGAWDILLQLVFPALAIITLWIYRSATPGKNLTNIIIVDANTLDKPSAKQCVIRYLAYYPGLILFGVGFFAILFDEKKRGWHDRIANTLVVHKETAIKT